MYVECADVANWVIVKVSGEERRHESESGSAAAILKETTIMTMSTDAGLEKVASERKSEDSEVAGRVQKTRNLIVRKIKNLSVG